MTLFLFDEWSDAPDPAWLSLPRSQKKAIESGSVSYFTGRPCVAGHVERRYTHSSICYACKRDQARRDYFNHTDRVKESNERSRFKHWEKAQQRAREWTEKNKDKVRAIKAAHRERHREKYLLKARLWARNKRASSLQHRISRNVSKAVWSFLKGKKHGLHWFDLIGYGPEELMAHIESQFTDGMSWENYGKWVIDHIIPQDWFQNAPLPEKPYWVRFAWSLCNLRPLWYGENASKCNRMPENASGHLANVLDAAVAWNQQIASELRTLVEMKA